MDSREELIARLRIRCKREAEERNQAYDRYGWDNKPETVDPDVWKAADMLAALATPSPEAAGSAEAPVAAGEVNRELEKIADWWEPHWRGAGITPTADWLIKEIKAHAEASFEAVTAAQAKGDARAQDFRAGIEAAAKVARAARFQSYGPQDHPERIAEAIEALAPPAGAGEVWNLNMAMAPQDGSEVCCLAPEYKGPVMLRWYTEAWRDWDGDTCNPTAWFALPAAPGDGG